MSAPDLTTYYAVHRGLRVGMSRLAAAVADLDPADGTRAKALQTFWKGYLGEVLVHHRVEDEIFMPALVERLPSAARHVVRVDDDHAHLDVLLDRSIKAMAVVAAGGSTSEATDVLAEISNHLTDHLAFEDADVVPLLGEYLSAAEYDALEKRAAKLVPVGKQAAFTVPFLMDAVSPEDRAHFMATAPLPLKLLWYATRGRYARLAATAFGTMPEPARVC